MIEDFTPVEFVHEREEDERWQLLDVREDWETEIASVRDSLQIPMTEVPARLAELDKSRPIAVLCHSGGRSAKVAGYLANAGFTTVRNVAGGIEAWSLTIDPEIPAY